MAGGLQREVAPAQLVARCRAGDEVAWRELVERYAPYVAAIALQGFRLPHADAEDAFQDVFARVWERLGELRSDAALTPWIGQVARRTCIDVLRARRREEPGAAVCDTGDDAALAAIDEALAVRQAMAALSPDCRDVLDRFFRRDESYATISAALGIPQGTIASRISRCLARLRTELEGRNGAAGLS